MSERLYDDHHAATSEHARVIGDMMEPALKQVVDYCVANNVDLEDAMGYCHRCVGFTWAKNAVLLGIEACIKERKEQHARNKAA